MSVTSQSSSLIISFAYQSNHSLSIFNITMLLRGCARAQVAYHATLRFATRPFPRPAFIQYRFSSKSESESGEATGQSDLLDDQRGTQYSNWVLARSAKFNHDVSFLKRKYGRDRYNIHKLTNMDFMCTLVNRQDKYALNLNEKIVLLAQMNHVCNVLKKDKGMYGQFGHLTEGIKKGIKDPDDYICMGTFMNVLVDLGNFNEKLWILIMDALFVKKYDEEYDELFGLYSGLYKYKQNMQELCDYFQLQKNKIIFNIPIVYRNSLEVVRQYVKFNIYNLKECRILFRSLHLCKINQKHFWKSVSNWFNIYIKEQLQRKDFQEFFIVSENAVDKVLFDDGMIRPRSVLQELAEIAYILSEYGFISDRFIHFIEDLINFSIENGSELFIKFLELEKEENQKNSKKDSVNQHIKASKQTEREALKAMEKRYRTIFVNPTDLSSESIVQILIVLKRSIDIFKQQKEDGQKNHAGRSGAIDQRVLNWLLVRLCQPKMKYTLNQLLKIIQCQDFLHAMRLNLNSLILQKVKDVRSKVCSLQDLKNILMFLPQIQFQSISYIMEDFLFRAHPKDIFQLTQLIERESMSPEDYELLQEQFNHINKGSESEEGGQFERSYMVAKERHKRWMPYMTNYFLKLPSSVNAHENYYSFDENCYFLYLLLKNEEYWDSKIGYEYLGEMQKLKHSIKIASYSRGYKLQMGTYFYKLMNYIDLVAFFEGG